MVVRFGYVNETKRIEEKKFVSFGGRNTLTDCKIRSDEIAVGYVFKNGV